MMNEVSTLNPTATPNSSTTDNYQPDHLFVANLKSISLEKLVRSKLEVFFEEQKETATNLDGLYSLVIEQVEKPLIELALRAHKGNQVKTAKMLGINRNTLKKKMDMHKIKVRALATN